MKKKKVAEIMRGRGPFFWRQKRKKGTRKNARRIDMQLCHAAAKSTAEIRYRKLFPRWPSTFHESYNNLAEGRR